MFAEAGSVGLIPTACSRTSTSHQYDNNRVMKFHIQGVKEHIRELNTVTTLMQETVHNH
jgi:hypothetical protein